jgi:hypothetical protein
MKKQSGIHNRKENMYERMKLRADIVRFIICLSRGAMLKELT